MSVVVCSWGAERDGLPAGAEELLGLGRKLAHELERELVWLLLGPVPERALEVASAHGVSALERIEDAALGHLHADVYVEALAQYWALHAPAVGLFSQSFDTRLIAPRLAGRTGAAVVMNGVAAGLEAHGDLEVTAAAYGGDTRAVYRIAKGRPCLIACPAGAFRADPPQGAGSSPELRSVPVALGSVEERIRVVQSARSEGPRLEDAQIIVAGGRGLGSVEHYAWIEKLAAALGGVPAASRPLVDERWVDASRQVGLTGRITRPALYLAAGISGASQHMAGCAAAKTIAAINRDRDAAIFRYARYGIVGDCLEILPELVRAAKER